LYSFLYIFLCHPPELTSPDRIGGFVGAIYSPDWFIGEQIPSPVPVTTSANSRLVALQLGNLYLLLCMVGLAVLSTTTEIKVVRNYLIALWVADIGHIALTWYALGNHYFTDVSRWNAMTWGNIGATVRLPLSFRYSSLSLAYLLTGATQYGRPFCS